MSAHGEKTLIQHLTEFDSLVVIAQEGMDIEVVPTVELREMVEFSIDYYYASGCTAAPSITMLAERFCDLLEECNIDIEEAPEDTIEWAIDDLRAGYAHLSGQTFVKDLAIKLAEASPEQKLEVLQAGIDDLLTITTKLEDKSFKVDMRDIAADRLRAYDARTENRGMVRGSRIGFDDIDAYLKGIHPGEVGVFAAGPKVGKSYLMAYIALQEWLAGRTPVLYTLENGVEMTVDRLACLYTGVSSRDWMHGTCTATERALMAEAVEQFTSMDNPLWVLKPDRDHRKVGQMVREAQVRGCDTLLIDQLTFVDLPSPRAPKTERIGQALHELHDLVSTGRKRIPCLLAHQINREGVNAAAKDGRLYMHHMAESAEVERTADHVFGLYAGEEDKRAQRIKIQLLASRREVERTWQMKWDVNHGIFAVTGVL